MKETPLELATTSEIIEELLERETFAGIILHSKNDHKGQAHDHFCIHSALSADDAIVLLEIALNALEQQSHGT